MKAPMMAEPGTTVYLAVLALTHSSSVRAMILQLSLTLKTMLMCWIYQDLDIVI